MHERTVIDGETFDGVGNLSLALQKRQINSHRECEQRQKEK